MFGYIYITTNNINNKKYIGKHESNKIDNYLGSGTLLTRSIKKYGIEHFKKEILFVAETEEELNRLEIKTILEHNAVKNSDYYNISEGGTGGNTLAGKSQDEMYKFGQQVKNRWKNYSSIELDEIKDKISKKLLGKPKSAVHKDNIRNSKKNKSRNWTNVSRDEYAARRKEEVRKGINVPPTGNRGNKTFRHTDESKERIRTSLIARKERRITELGYNISPEQTKRKAEIGRKNIQNANLLHKQKMNIFIKKMIPIFIDLYNHDIFLPKDIVAQLNLSSQLTFKNKLWTEQTISKLLKTINKNDMILSILMLDSRI